MPSFPRPSHALLSSLLVLASCSSSPGSVTGKDAGEARDGGNTKDTGAAKEGGKPRDAGDAGGGYACGDGSTQEAFPEGPITGIACVDAGGLPSCTGTAPYSCPNDPGSKTACYCGATSWSSGTGGWICVGHSCGTGTGFGSGSDGGGDTGSGAGSGSGS